MSWDLSEAIAYYRKQGAPNDQNALIALLREIQSQHGGSIPMHLLPQIAREYQTKESFLSAVIRRVPSLRLGNIHCLELCAGPNCGKHTALAAHAEHLQKASGGKITLKYMPCMRMCGKGPNIRWDGQLHHKATVQLLEELTRNL